MKLIIRSAIAKGLTHLLNTKIPNNLCISFGKMLRTGFQPFVCSYDVETIKKHLLSHKNTKCKIKENIKYIYDIGFISYYYIVCGIGEGQDVDGLLYSFESYDIIVTSKSITVRFTTYPEKLSDFFDPVKFVFGFINDTPYEKIINQQIINKYNKLLGKDQEHPYIVQQGIRYLSKPIDKLIDYIAVPQKKGDEYSLFFCDNGVYMISHSNIYCIAKKSPKSLYNTILVGDWFEKTFTAYDALVVNKKDVKRFVLTKRIKYLYAVNKRFPLCKVAEYTTYDLTSNVSNIVSTHTGIMLCPVKANYVNNKTYIYQPIQNVSIHFQVCKQGMCYVLKTGKELKPFSGTKEYPYISEIPLTREDREFIGIEDCVIWEFKWTNNGFVPYQLSRSKYPTNTILTKQIWKYINEPYFI